MSVEMQRFPRLYAAASLKQRVALTNHPAITGFPRLYAAASLKRRRGGPHRPLRRRRFPRLYAAASLKLAGAAPRAAVEPQRFPRLYAAASLKHLLAGEVGGGDDGFSAALCRGLIEAESAAHTARASISVFRGFMPRPH